MIRNVFGINIAVRDLAAAVEKFEAILGIKARYSNAEDFAFPGLKGASFSVGGVNISLVASETDDSVIANFLKTRGEGVLLISFETDDVDAEVEKLRDTALQFLMPKNAEGKFGKVNFIHPKSLHGVQVELIQPSDAFKAKSKE
jgi:methylmalonyl-CoA/ethylmalonyl-CoA epimerase